MELSDYLNLITPWYANQPKFVNTIAALIQPLVDAMATIDALSGDFDLDTAIGVQLDAVGRWIGRTRYVDVPVTNVFFAFDLPANRVGFDQGIWLGEYDPTDAISALDDGTYRSILKLQVIANSWDGTLESIMAAMDAVYPGVVIQDKGDVPGGRMTMDILIPASFINSLLLSVLEQDFPIKPGGVEINIIETTVSTQPIFAFDLPLTAGGPFGGLDQAAWGQIILTA